MKKNIVVIVLALFTFTSVGSAVAGQLDPFWKVQRDMKAHSVGVEKGVGFDDVMIDVFIKSADVRRTASGILNTGGEVRSIIGSIMTASISSDVIEDVADWPEVEYIEAGKPVKRLNDLADADTGVTSVVAGTNLPHGYDGTGVIVGIIDSGIDLTHPAFLDAAGESRVLYLWDQESTIGTGPSEISSTYGTEYNHAAIMAGGVAELDTEGHGTHVAGTTAGRDATYPGVASNADLIVVKADLSLDENFSSPGICDAANYIFQKALMLGRSAVINISIGSHYGSHDGTSLYEQCFDELVEESSGRAIVASAGNEGSNYNITGTHTGGRHATLAVSSGGGSGVAFNEYAISERSEIDIWGEQGCTVDILVDLWNAGGWLDSTDWISNGNEMAPDFLRDGFTSCALVIIDRSEVSNSQNGKWHAQVSVIPTSAYSPQEYFFSVGIQGTCSSPSLDMWAASSTVFFHDLSGGGWYPGDNAKTTSIPATAANVIAVGAHVTRTSWTDSGGNPQSDPLGLLTDLDALAYFSSRGPALAAAQGQKPNITAPGAYIISALSSAASPESSAVVDSNHQVMAGTSMASPHVAGIVALMLQANPGLSYSEIMTYLQNTARADSFVGSAPNDDWGYGKVDAQAALAAVVADHPSGADDGDYSGIALTGITEGATDVSADMQSIDFTFPRVSDGSSCICSNLYLVPISPAAQIISAKGAWDGTICDASAALPATIVMTDTQRGNIDLEQALGVGDFAFCVSQDVRDSDGISFGGKTVQFSTISGGGDGGSGGGCRLAGRGGSSSPFTIISFIAALALVGITKRRRAASR